MKVANIEFPEFSGIRCLMMPYIQGEPSSVPEEYRKGYEKILAEVFCNKGDVGYLTIDESRVLSGNPHRGDRSKFGRALHTEVGRLPDKLYCWGGGNWAGKANVYLGGDTKVLVANNLDDSCAIWDSTHENTSIDGDIGDCSSDYPYTHAVIAKAGEVHKIGILTPHESLVVKKDFDRQFIRIISGDVKGREPYFTKNRLMN